MEIKVANRLQKNDFSKPHRNKFAETDVFFICHSVL